MKDSTKRALEVAADFDGGFSPAFDQDMIGDWAESADGGGLPHESAWSMATWLDRDWNDFEDPEATPYQSNLDVLMGALDHWTGGRVAGKTEEGTQ